MLLNKSKFFKVFIIYIIFPLFLIANSINNTYPKKLTFVYSFEEKNPLTQWHISIYKEALSRIGIELVFLDVPAKRAKVYVAQGIVDGDLGRVYTFGDKIKNIVRVEEHNHIVSWSAYSINPNLKLKGWESLKDKNFIVEYRRGVKMSENKLPLFIPSDKLTSINTINQGLTKLLLGRTDLFIGVDDIVNEYLDKKGETRIYNVGNMQTITGHAWINKKYSNIAIELSKILKEMKKEGLFNKYLEQHNLNPKYLRW